MADDQHDYKVGRRCIPVSEKGQSGNPGGRSQKKLHALLAAERAGLWHDRRRTSQDHQARGGRPIAGQQIRRRRFAGDQDAVRHDQGRRSEGQRLELKEEIGSDSAEILAESRRWLYHNVPEDITSIMGGRYRGNRRKWFPMRFTGADADINLATAHAEFDAWEWVRPEQLSELIVPSMRQVYFDVPAEFRAFW